MTFLPRLNRIDPRTSWPGFLLASGAILAVVFTLLDPGQSQGLPGPKVLVFWVSHVTGALCCLQAAQLGLQRFAAVRSWRPVLQMIAGGIAGSALFTPLALALDRVLGVAALTDDAEEALLAGLVGEFAAVTPVVTLTWLALNATRMLRLPSASMTARPAAGFWAKVPAHLGRDLVAFSAELHYLRVHTTQGDALVLYAFGKAIEEEAQGMQIHRSHWVALAHVDRIERRGREGICHLTGGLQLPVSRRFRSTVEERLADAA